MCAQAGEGRRGEEQRANCQDRHTRSEVVGWGYLSNPHRTTAELRPSGGGTGKTLSPGFEESANFKRDHLDIMWLLMRLREKGEVASPSNKDRLPNDGICRLKNFWGL